MDLQYLVYTVDGDTFKFRKIQGRDILTLTSKVPVLPESRDSGGTGDLVRSIRINEQMLAACSVAPKLILDAPDPIPVGCVPIPLLSDSTVAELLKRLTADSGYSKESAAALDPSSATVEG